MKELRFDWDHRKEKANIRKHGISFEEALTAFYDESAVQFYDPDHSDEEDRFILLGLTFKTTGSRCLPLFSGERNGYSRYLGEKS